MERPGRSRRSRTGALLFGRDQQRAQVAMNLDWVPTWVWTILIAVATTVVVEFAAKPRLEARKARLLRDRTQIDEVIFTVQGVAMQLGALLEIPTGSTTPLRFAIYTEQVKELAESAANARRAISRLSPRPNGGIPRLHRSAGAINASGRLGRRCRASRERAPPGEVRRVFPCLRRASRQPGATDQTCVLASRDSTRVRNREHRSPQLRWYRGTGQIVSPDPSWFYWVMIGMTLAAPCLRYIWRHTVPRAPRLQSAAARATRHARLFPSGPATAG